MVYNIPANDTKKDHKTGTVDSTSLQNNAGGLPSILSISIDARVMLTKNIDVSDGLINSSAGVVTGFIPKPDPISPEDFNPKYILIQFDDKRVGH